MVSMSPSSDIRIHGSLSQVGASSMKLTSSARKTKGHMTSSRGKENFGLPGLVFFPYFIKKKNISLATIHYLISYILRDKSGSLTSDWFLLQSLHLDPA